MQSGHFGSGIDLSQIDCDCHPSMLSTIGINTRRGFSDIDFALLKDMGYSISASPIRNQYWRSVPRPYSFRILRYPS